MGIGVPQHNVGALHALPAHCQHRIAASNVHYIHSLARQPLHTKSSQRSSEGDLVQSSVLRHAR